ncbi:hypothetical protein HDV01_007319 [Terramyces sp. JEL0728]|nr:hypothetical protein HDV01_007319 [Terramyces sp. JEL0728]
MISQFDIQEWVDSARDSIASPINDLGTVQINETELQTTNIPKLRDLFEPAQPAFMQVFEPEKGLFKNKYDTLTRNQLSEIMETINYPEKDQTIDLERYKANREEYPENIDFLDQPSDEEPSLENAHEEQQADLFTDKPIKHHSELDHPIIEKEDHSHLIDSVKEIKTTDRYSSPNDDTPMNYRQPKKIHRSQSDVAMQFKHLEDSLHNVSNYIARGVEIDCTDLNKTEKSSKNGCSLTTQRQINPFGTSNDYIDLGNLNLDSLQGLINAKTNYRKVIASNNQLKFVDEIPNSTGSLFIGRNQLSNLTSFSHLKCLKILDISFNCLTDLSALSNLYHLEELSAEGNQINSLSIKNSNLRKLRLKGNQIVRCDFENVLSSRLEYLDLSENALENVKNIQYLGYLTTLMLKCNLKTLKISNNAQFTWQSIPIKLEILEAGGCNLKSIPQILLKCHYLKSIILENNQLSDISVLESLRSLTTVYLSSNNITDITRVCKSLAKLPNLTFLDFRGNQIAQETASQSQRYVYNVIIKMLLINSIKTLAFLDLNPITARDRRIAQRRSKVIKKIAGEYSSKAQTQWFKNWKPELYPVEDLTVDEELVLQVLN